MGNAREVHISLSSPWTAGVLQCGGAHRVGSEGEVGQQVRVCHWGCCKKWRVAEGQRQVFVGRIENSTSTDAEDNPRCNQAKACWKSDRPFRRGGEIRANPYEQTQVQPVPVDRPRTNWRTQRPVDFAGRHEDLALLRHWPRWWRGEILNGGCLWCLETQTEGRELRSGVDSLDSSLDSLDSWWFFISCFAGHLWFSSNKPIMAVDSGHCSSKDSGDTPSRSQTCHDMLRVLYHCSH